MSLCQKIKLSNPYIFTTGWCRPLIFQTYIIWSNGIFSLKYLRSTTLGCKDIRIRKFEFVTKTQFLWGLTFRVVYISVLKVLRLNSRGGINNLTQGCLILRLIYVKNLFLKFVPNQCLLFIKIVRFPFLIPGMMGHVENGILLKIRICVILKLLMIILWIPLKIELNFFWVMLINNNWSRYPCHDNF